VRFPKLVEAQIAWIVQQVARYIVRTVITCLPTLCLLFCHACGKVVRPRLYRVELADVLAQVVSRQFSCQRGPEQASWTNAAQQRNLEKNRCSRSGGQCSSKSRMVVGLEDLMR
jgi:hypothetical protein